MRTKNLLSLLAIITLGMALNVSAGAQVVPSAEGDATGVNEDTMMTPPPVSGAPYASEGSGNVRTDYVSAGIVVTPGFIDNVLPGTAQKPVANFTMSINPTVSFNRAAARHQEQFSYNPTFSIYDPTSSLNYFGQSASGSFLYRFSPHLSLNASDTFVKTSDIFNQPYVFSSPVTGSTLSTTQTIIAPFTGQLMNSVNAELAYQPSRNAMIGGGGLYEHFGISQSTQATGLGSSDEYDGLVFYSRRLMRSQYLGLSYKYAYDSAYSTIAPPATTRIQSVLPFYTLYISRKFSISGSAGFAHVSSDQFGSASTQSWTPSITVSGGWQFTRGSIAVAYSHAITTGGGLLGAYHSNGYTASGGTALSRRWNARANVAYSSINSATPSISSLTFSSGNTLAVDGTLAYAMSERFNLSFGYERLSEQYQNVPAVNGDPNSNREFMSVSYRFTRPLGR